MQNIRTLRWNNDEVVSAIEEALGRGVEVVMIVESDFRITNSKLQKLVDTGKIQLKILPEGVVLDHRFAINEKMDCLYFGSKQSILWLRNTFSGKLLLDILKELEGPFKNKLKTENYM